MEPKSMGEVLKDIRIERGMSQSELATILGYKDRTTRRMAASCVMSPLHGGV